MNPIYFLILLTICLVSCSSCGSKKSFSQKENTEIGRVVIDNSENGIFNFPVKEDSTFVLTNDLDLEGKNFLIPRGVTIKQKQGVIKNGTLIGNGTKIDAKKALFEKVKIKGEWNVPKISTDLFVDLSYDNALRNVVALSSNKVHNIIKIKEGIYSFSFIKNGDIGLSPASNTKLQIDGTLWIKGNEYKNYYIVNIKGSNIDVFGKGVIEGDKYSHTGKEGEWGMGVNFANATNCTLSGLTIKNCWGDCVYIGRHSKNCSVSNCIISNVNGTAPEFAIDIEPNKGDTVKNVIIKDVTVNNCVGGFLIYTGKNNSSYVESVEFSKCTINTIGKKGMMKFIRCHDVKVTRNKFLDGHLKHGIMMNETKEIIFTGNTFKASEYVMNTISDVTFHDNIIYGGDLFPMDVKNMVNSIMSYKIRGNRIIKNDETK